MRQAVLIGMIWAALAAGGCTTGQYRSQPLGAVSYNVAFQQARGVFCQYYSVAEADYDKGKIVGRPKLIGSRSPLGQNPIYELATMRVRQRGHEMVAEIRVEVKTEDIEATRSVLPVTEYNQYPTEAPALTAGALTPGQDTAWISLGRNEAVERSILRDLLNCIAACKQRSQ